MEDTKKEFFIGLVPTKETEERLCAIATQVQETFNIENRFLSRPLCIHIKSMFRADQEEIFELKEYLEVWSLRLRKNTRDFIPTDFIIKNNHIFLVLRNDNFVVQKEGFILDLKRLFTEGDDQWMTFGNTDDVASDVGIAFVTVSDSSELVRGFLVDKLKYINCEKNEFNKITLFVKNDQEQWVEEVSYDIGKT
jgi:hypothetical protein